MKHEDYQDLYVLSRYGELDAAEQADLEKHLSECSVCRLAVEDLRRMHQFLDENPEQPPEKLLKKFRRQLFSRLRREAVWRPKSFGNSWSESLRLMLKPFPAAALAASLLIGLCIGYLGLRPDEFGSSGIQIDSILEKPVRISEVQFKETGFENGEVELTFNVSRRVSLRSQLDDPRIQRVLAHALIREQNTGVRLQAISAIGTREGVHGQRQIQAALVAAMKTDENPAVRQQSLKVLLNYSNQPEVIEAMIHVLKYDSNVRLRMEAIEILQGVLSTNQGFSDEVESVLKEKMQNDENHYVRDQARMVLQNAGYQHF